MGANDMTRKDFILIAHAFNVARQDVENKEPVEHHENMLDGISLAAEHVADSLRRTNERFDRAKFLAACGVQS
jgi:hypothetical protein